MLWVDKKRQPIPLGAFPQERSDQLIPRLLATGKAAPSRTGRLRRLRRAEDDEVLASFPRRSTAQLSTPVTPTLAVPTQRTESRVSR